MLINKFNLEYSYLRRLIPTVAGFAIGILVIMIAMGVKWIFDRIKESNSRTETFQLPSLGYWILLVFLLAGFLLSPTKLLGGGRNEYDCSGDMISSYQAAGNHLAEQIPPGSLVYWKGNLSTVPLLYVPDIKIYPSQINASYSFKQEGDEDMLLKFGFWSPDLAKKWIIEADYVLIEQQYFKGWEKEMLKSDRFVELEPSPQSSGVSGRIQNPHLQGCSLGRDIIIFTSQSILSQSYPFSFTDCIYCFDTPTDQTIKHSQG